MSSAVAIQSAAPAQVAIGTLTGGASAWLSPAAAASYTAMRAAGMPAGGITSAGRTNAEQRALYATKPDLAAEPGKSPHEAGIALDMAQTSDAHKWLLANGAKFGWSRPLSYEPWHWKFGDGSGGGSDIPVVGPLVDAAGNLLGDAAAGVGNLLGLGDIANDVRIVGLQIVFVIAGLGLVVLGLSRTVSGQVSKVMGEVL